MEKFGQILSALLITPCAKNVRGSNKLLVGAAGGLKDLFGFLSGS